jgi:hypothetical protein
VNKDQLVLPVPQALSLDQQVLPVNKDQLVLPVPQALSLDQQVLQANKALLEMPSLLLVLPHSTVL